jgi:hypothetical protein
MSDLDDIEKQIQEAKDKEIKRRRRIAEKKYSDEKEEIKKRNYTSFGKLILSNEKTCPIVSFTGAERFNKLGMLPKTETPGPIYSHSNNIKFHKPSEWKIGTSRRPELSSSEKFEYYNHKYDEYKDYDISKLPKKWMTVKGGAIPLDPRIKFEIRENYPGPGRYEPNVSAVKHKSPSYFLGEKGNLTSIKNVTGTNEYVGPGRYSVEKCAYESKHLNEPNWSLPQSKRKGLEMKTWTAHESYYIYR